MIVCDLTFLLLSTYLIFKYLKSNKKQINKKDVKNI